MLLHCRVTMIDQKPTYLKSDYFKGSKDNEVHDYVV